MAAKSNNEKGYEKIIEEFNKSNILGGYHINDRSSGGMQLLNPQGSEVTVPLKPLKDPH